jgi:hypothetical protein
VELYALEVKRWIRILASLSNFHCGRMRSLFLLVWVRFWSINQGKFGGHVNSIGKGSGVQIDICNPSPDVGLEACQISVLGRPGAADVRVTNESCTSPR